MTIERFKYSDWVLTMSFPTISDNPELNQALFQAISFGLISEAQAYAYCEEHSSEEILLILEQIASDQMGSGHQCIGGECML